jgi:hypothetical protein
MQQKQDGTREVSFTYSPYFPMELNLQIDNNSTPVYPFLGACAYSSGVSDFAMR